MASGKTLNATNLAALGAAPLAELLIEISKGNAAAQRRLRLALAGGAGATEAARMVAKRLASIGQARTWLDWQKIKPLAAELESHRRAIMDLVAPADPREAFELAWRLVGCARPVSARSDDGAGLLAAAFAAACADLGPLAQKAAFDPGELADRAFRVLTDDGADAWHGLVPVLAPQLGAAGLDGLGALVRAWQAEPVAVPADGERRVIGWSSAGPIHADAVARRQRNATASLLLQQVADLRGDVDGFIAQFDERARMMPLVAAGIARRLLAAGRLEDAAAAVARAEPGRRAASPEWEAAHLEVLEASGQLEEAQAFRWARFLQVLDVAHLRAHLKRLPDFDDFEAEQRALDHASAFKDVHQALAFLVAWPALDRAAALVLGRGKGLNGDLYELLAPAAEALDGKYPLAATVLRRAMVGFTLKAGRSARYKHAARHLAACAAAARQIGDFGALPDHAAYERALRAAHGRKAGFWQALAALS